MEKKDVCATCWYNKPVVNVEDRPHLKGKFLCSYEGRFRDKGKTRCKYYTL